MKITTEVDNEGANRQLRTGLCRLWTLHFYDKDMVTYVLDLQSSPRVEPRGHHPMVE